MNIYLISQDANDNYDTYDAAVVVAESAEKARQMHPHPGVHSSSSTWVSDSSLVKVKLVGTTERCRPGVILASFNAG